MSARAHLSVVEAPAPVVNLAVVGLGYWGPNLLRNAWETEGVHVKAACDFNKEALARQGRRYPGMTLTDDLDRLLADPELDGVLLATPVSTHFPLAMKCLQAGKHVMVEKPLANSAAECARMIEAANKRGLVLMPGHTFLYSPPVVAVKGMLERGERGELCFGN